MEGKGVHYMGYRLLSGIKNDFVLKFSLFFIQSILAIIILVGVKNSLGKQIENWLHNYLKVK